MDFSIYIDEIRDGVDEVSRLLMQPGSRIFSALKHLERCAVPYKDDALNGYVWFHYAHAYYYRDFPDQFHEYLTRAFRCLLRCDEPELLARTCNFFAADAQNVGCFSIAYHYYQMALSFVGEADGSLMKGLIDSNIGALLSEMGEFRKAVSHIRKSIPVIKKHPEDTLYFQNLYTVYINLGLNCLYAGDLKGARRITPQIEKVAKKTIDPGNNTHLWLRLYSAMLAFAEDDIARTRTLLADVTEQLKTTTVLAELSSDLMRFCSMLIAKGEISLAGKLISAFPEWDPMVLPVYRKLQFTQLAIEYCDAAGDTVLLDEMRKRRRALYRQHLEEQKVTHLHSARLMMEMESLRREREETIQENERLQRMAQTDALTGVANRYALNQYLEQHFEQAWRRQRLFGVGVVDIDAFKHYNDTYGHPMGDECLRAVADALSAIAAEHDLFVARYGGDEFVLVYENLTNEEILGIEEEIHAVMPIPVSHGFYNAVPGQHTRLWDHLSRADACLYKMKKKKR